METSVTVYLNRIMNSYTEYKYQLRKSYQVKFVPFSLTFGNNPCSKSEQDIKKRMHESLQDDQQKENGEYGLAGVILVIKDFVNIMLSIFVHASRAPVNNSEKHIN